MVKHTINHHDSTDSVIKGAAERLWTGLTAKDGQWQRLLVARDNLYNKLFSKTYTAEAIQTPHTAAQLYREPMSAEIAEQTVGTYGLLQEFLPLASVNSALRDSRNGYDKLEELERLWAQPSKLAQSWRAAGANSPDAQETLGNALHRCGAAARTWHHSTKDAHEQDRPYFKPGQHEEFGRALREYTDALSGVEGFLADYRQVKSAVHERISPPTTHVQAGTANRNSGHARRQPERGVPAAGWTARSTLHPAPAAAVARP